MRAGNAGSTVCARSLAVLVAMVSLASGQASIDETTVERTLYVDVDHPNADDANDGTNSDLPLATIQAAVDNARGADTRIVVADGDYRAYVDITSDEHLLIIEAANAGEARITGSDLAGDIRHVSGSVYAIHWPHDWGMGNTVFSGYSAEYWRARRKEMVFVNGQRLTQRMTVEADGDVNDPVAIGELQSGEFTVDEAKDSMFFTPPTGVSVTEETIVEISVRGTAEKAFGDNSGILVDIIDHPNLVLRGLVFQHSANHIKSDPAVRIKSTSSGGTDRRRLSQDILIERCSFSDNKSSGFKMQNSRNVTIRNCRFSDNGIVGSSTNCLEHVLWDSCTFSGNNWAGGFWMAGHHGAGAKMCSGQDKDGWFPAKTDSVLFHKCVFSDNGGPGFWQDYGGSNVTLEQCLVENNQSRGVDNEMTFGAFTLKNCVVRDNGVCNVQVYGSSNMTFDGCVIYGAKATRKPSDPQYIANFRMLADDRTNDNVHADIRHHTIVNSVIIATRPHTCNYRIVKYGSAELETFGKLPYINTLTSDYNRWYRRDQESFPWPHVFLGTRTFPGEGWKEAWPDMTWDEYRALTPESGRRLDEHSVWGDVDLERVADSVLSLSTPTAAVVPRRQSMRMPVFSASGRTLRFHDGTHGLRSIVVTDAQGRVVLRKQGVPAAARTFSLPSRGSRILFVRVESDGGVLTRSLTLF